MSFAIHPCKPYDIPNGVELPAQEFTHASVPVPTAGHLLLSFSDSALNPCR